MKSCRVDGFLLILIGLFSLIINNPLEGQENIGDDRRTDQEPSQKEVSSKTSPLFFAPLKTGGNNLFHSLILIPPLESAEIIDTGKGYIQTGLDYAVGNFKKERRGWLLDYDANLVESFVDIQYGFSEGVELKATLTGGVLAEDNDELRLYKNNVKYVSGERTIGLSDFILGAKFRLVEAMGKEEELPFTGALGIWLKIPLAKGENLLSSDGIDLAIAYIETDKIDEDLFVHTQIGYTFTGKEYVFKENVDISNTLFYGAGLSWLASENTVLIGQIQGNLNAFRGIKVLNKHPLAVQGGFRYSGDEQYFIESSVGFGLNDESSDFTMMFSIGKAF